MYKESEKKLRSYILENLKKELIGPGSEGVDELDIENERISESPLQRYSLGILYPRNVLTGYDVSIEEENSIEHENSEPEIPHDQKKKNELDAIIDEDTSLNSANQYCPSTLGVSFIVSKQTKILEFIIEAAKYRQLIDKDEKREKSENAYLLLPPDEIEFIQNLNIDIFEWRENKLFFNMGYNPDQHAAILNGLEKNQRQKFWLFYNKAKAFKYGKLFIRQPINEIRNRLELNEIECDVVKNICTSEEGLLLYVKKRSFGDKFKVTVTLSNNNSVTENNEKFSHPELAYFQCGLQISVLNSESFNEFENSHIGHSAEKLDRLLYRNKKIFAVGHGCSVSWEGNKPDKLRTDFIPKYEVPQTSFGLDNNNELKCLDVKYLADENSNKSELIEDLKKFAEQYNNWIKKFDNEIENIPDFKETAIINKKLCEETYDRIIDGIKLLENDNTIYDCFRLMNEAMMMQRFHSQNYVRNPRSVDQNDFPEIPTNYFNSVKSNSFQWRPFQLAFILLSLESIVNSESTYRGVADLIWFPTGGGKTEAYLGVIALTIFYRRKSKVNENFLGTGGTAVIMRYTLRLLTAQQYQRASTLICACEKLRQLKPEELGTEKITIGLWVGSANTPNNCADARGIINRHINNTLNIADENPFQILYCPWCGTSLIDDTNRENIGFRGRYALDGVDYQFMVRCINQNCSFNTYLPLQVIDEEIYDKPTTLLLATADKFAMLAHEPKTRSLFGDCGNAPPELIIQDELHLISGPLGSLFGMYETIIDYLCLNGGVPPKVISSTATIKKADQQIRAVFNRDSRLFPPPGLNAEDSFFAKELPINDESYGRLYVGIMSIGMTQQTGQVRALAALLYYNLKYYYDDSSLSEEEKNELVDKYYTIVGYYNTIRELGIACSLLDDDISARFKQLVARKREIYPRPIWYKELTSRVDSKEIPLVLNDLENKKLTITENIYDLEAIPIVLSSNMFSVGVDIPRLNLMFMSGQPKTNAEYIQSTSRVGRADPGLVVVLFDGFRPRDRSHFENFQSFHQSFYRFVEPTSVTPFSLPVRRRALHTLLIIYARLRRGLIENQSADKFNNDLIDKDYLNFLESRVSNIDPSQTEQFWEELGFRISQWIEFSTPQNENKRFARKTGPFAPHNPEHIPLMKAFGDEKGLWPVLTSLRNVDVPTFCFMKEN